jgi:hypothetical protein
MAVSTTKAQMIVTQWPAGSFMGEWFLNVPLVAHFTSIFLLVAVITGLVMLGEGLDGLSGDYRVVAMATILLPVATDTSKVKDLYVLVVMKGDKRTVFIIGFENDRIGFLNIWVQYSHDVGWIRDNYRGFISCFANMTNTAFCLMAPLPVAAKALTVIGALQARPVDVLGVFRATMTITAGKNQARRIMVMTEFTSSSHLGHFRV